MQKAIYYGLVHRRAYITEYIQAMGSFSVNVGDRYVLRCGHVGRVVWIAEDGNTMAVRGDYHPSCQVFCKNRQTRNVYLIPRDR